MDGGKEGNGNLEVNSKGGTLESNQVGHGCPSGREKGLRTEHKPENTARLGI